MPKDKKDYLEYVKNRSPWGTPWYGGGDQYKDNLGDKGQAWIARQRKKSLILLGILFIVVLSVVILLK